MKQQELAFSVDDADPTIHRCANRCNRGQRPRWLAMMVALIDNMRGFIVQSQLMNGIAGNIKYQSRRCRERRADQEVVKEPAADPRRAAPSLLIYGLINRVDFAKKV